MDLVAAGWTPSTAIHRQYNLIDAAKVYWCQTDNKIHRFVCRQHMRVDGDYVFAQDATSQQCKVGTELVRELNPVALHMALRTQSTCLQITAHILSTVMQI